MKISYKVAANAVIKHGLKGICFLNVCPVCVQLEGMMITKFSNEGLKVWILGIFVLGQRGIALL